MCVNDKARNEFFLDVLRITCDAQSLPNLFATFSTCTNWDIIKYILRSSHEIIRTTNSTTNVPQFFGSCCRTALFHWVLSAWRTPLSWSTNGQFQKSLIVSSQGESHPPNMTQEELHEIFLPRSGSENNLKISHINIYNIEKYNIQTDVRFIPSWSADTWAWSRKRVSRSPGKMEFVTAMRENAVPLNP